MNMLGFSLSGLAYLVCGELPPKCPTAVANSKTQKKQCPGHKIHGTWNSTEDLCYRGCYKNPCNIYPLPHLAQRCNPMERP